MTRNEYNNCADSYADGLYRFILKSCKSVEMAQDMVQESYLVLWEHVSEIAPEKAKAFLYTTAYRKMIDTLRREKWNADIETADISLNIADSPSAPDLNEILEKSLNRLPEIQRTVVLLRDYEAYSYHEIAQITSLSEEQVKVYIFRARNAMKHYIGTLQTVI